MPSGVQVRFLSSARMVEHGAHCVCHGTADPAIAEYQLIGPPPNPVPPVVDIGNLPNPLPPINHLFEPCDHDWRFVEQYTATTGRHATPHYVEGMVSEIDLSDHADWDEVDGTLATYLWCSNCDLEIPIAVDEVTLNFN